MADHSRRRAAEPRFRAARSLGRRLLDYLGPTPRLVAVLVLSLATAIWVASFVVAKGLVDDYDPMSMLVLRFAIGTAALWVLRPGAVRALAPVERWHAGVIGLLLGAAQVPHYFGIRESSASADPCAPWSSARGARGSSSTAR